MVHEVIGVQVPIPLKVYDITIVLSFKPFPYTSRSVPATSTLNPANMEEELVEIDKDEGTIPTVTVCVLVSVKPSLSVTVSLTVWLQTLP